jgi:hypothetical protein
MLKKSVILKAIRREMEAGNLYTVAVRRAGVRSEDTLIRWRERPMVNNYIKRLMYRNDSYRIKAMEDAHFKAGINGNVHAQINFLKKKDKEHWGDELPKTGDTNVSVEVNVPVGDIVFTNIRKDKDADSRAIHADEGAGSNRTAVALQNT